MLTARDIARRSYRRLQQNVVLAFLFDGIGVPLVATGVLYPIWAMVVMIVSVTAVLANSIWTKWSMMFSTLREVARRPGLSAVAETIQIRVFTDFSSSQD